MAGRLREHVSFIAGILSVLSLAAIFAAALQVIPGAFLPAAPIWFLKAIPHMNAALSLAAIGAIAYGWTAIRRGDIPRHRRAMLTGVVLFALFLVFYLFKVAVEGPTSFRGPSSVYQMVYLPLLGIHMVLAVICVPLLYYGLLLALTRPVHEIPLTRHPRVGRFVAPLWLLSFILGLAVYVLLYHLY